MSILVDICNLNLFGCHHLSTDQIFVLAKKMRDIDVSPGLPNILMHKM